MKKVQFNVSFKDRYTGKINVAGKCADMTEERVKEIKEVNPNFITVIGNVDVPDIAPNDIPDAVTDDVPDDVPKSEKKK